VAHSMGNRALTKALQRCSNAFTSRGFEFLFAAPDVAQSAFLARLAACSNTQNYTLYATNSDLALVGSALLRFFRERRAGDCSFGDLCLGATFDTVNCSTAHRAPDDGICHSYVYKCPDVAADVARVVLGHEAQFRESSADTRTLQALQEPRGVLQEDGSRAEVPVLYIVPRNRNRMQAWWQLHPTLQPSLGERDPWLQVQGAADAVPQVLPAPPSQEIIAVHTSSRRLWMAAAVLVALPLAVVACKCGSKRQNQHRGRRDSSDTKG